MWPAPSPCLHRMPENVVLLSFSQDSNTCPQFKNFRECERAFAPHPPPYSSSAIPRGKLSNTHFLSPSRNVLCTCKRYLDGPSLHTRRKNTISSVPHSCSVQRRFFCISTRYTTSLLSVAAWHSTARLSTM